MICKAVIEGVVSMVLVQLAHKYMPEYTDQWVSIIHYNLSTISSKISKSAVFQFIDL